ncbi:hypothetical protein H2O64_08945 [Kordia sp. YSTF-M3]|uniref:DUF1735 domain-containing protein n=1 Tax=Kordia aestuariivivens TaxID=2759037 RepID=A0ABR7Q8B5_9FLAO|nr:hypothetical protein [Kordia aestuariivivens]MBC8754795.1 hypothetical protein [Kordia aestuariivivens]
MKKIWLLLVLSFAFFSCDDGDLTLEEINLDTGTDIDACVVEAGVTLLFKINGAETLILEVPADLIVNTVTEATVVDGVVTPNPRTATLNSQAFCYYRSFDTTISNGYFCDEVPSDINITLEYAALAGEVEVTTLEIIDDVTNLTTGYKHTINLITVVFTGTNGQDVRDDLFEFGTIITPVE